MGMALMGPALYSATPGLGPNVGIGMPMEPNQPGMDGSFDLGNLLGANSGATTAPDVYAPPMTTSPTPYTPPMASPMPEPQITQPMTQPPANFMPRPDLGLGPNVGIGLPYEIPQQNFTQPINTVAQQVQQQVASPIYTQPSPFQPPMPAPAPITQPVQRQMPVQRTRPQPMRPAPQPIMQPRPELGPNVGIGMPMEPARQQPPQFVGGLRPAPVGYKPPVNAGGILRRRTR